MLATIVVCYYIVVISQKSKLKVNEVKSTLDEEKQKNRMLLDIASNSLMEASNLQSAITTIESLCRGASPAQSSLLEILLKFLKLQVR